VAIDQLVEEIQKTKDDKFIFYYYYKKVVEEENNNKKYVLSYLIDVKIRGTLAC